MKYVCTFSETFHLLLSEVARKKHVKKKAEWRHHDLCGIVEGDLTLPMTGCWFVIICSIKNRFKLWQIIIDDSLHNGFMDSHSG